VNVNMIKNLYSPFRVSIKITEQATKSEFVLF